jgi:predicted TPR repeat methyltransferase
LFDDFASHYDDTMLNKLGYQAHLHLRELADRVLPQRERGWRVLDLGCGTGLVGEAFGIWRAAAAWTESIWRRA